MNKLPYNVQEHYAIETKIAERLRNSTRNERLRLYQWAYDELYQKIPNHPLLSVSAEEKNNRIANEIKNMEVFLQPDSVYLEIGSGDCAIAAEVAKRVKQVYAIDVSKVVAKSFADLPNFELIITDGIKIPVAENSIDIAYSNQLMEHIHPEDEVLQLENVFRALKKGGSYFCITPNRLSGPHDISRNFDGVATGLHLKEYSVTEISELFKKIGFSNSKIYLRYSKFDLFLPIFPYKICEKFLDLLPHSFRKLLTFNKIVRFLLGVKIVATK
ncbi:MAG: class I SAM-dependent methyltransferase [Pyrinomonadaceae bacterium]|nr:class I SAM-dependent methyltransferase [Pyrinomonadaceae bacterium]